MFRSKLSTSLFAIFALVLVAGGGILLLNQLQQQQNVRSRADTVSVQWYTSQSATAACGSDGTAVISATFTNTESSSSMGMNVVVKDNQTGKSINLGTVNAKQTKTGTIDTGLSHINSNSVKFELSWANGSSGTDSRTASYPGAGPCVSPTNTPMPTLTPTLPPSTTPTPTPTSCPTPGTVNNIQIKCPYCSPTPSV